MEVLKKAIEPYIDYKLSDEDIFQTISLFPNNPKGSTWKYIGSTAYKSGVIKVDYLIDKTC